VSGLESSQARLFRIRAGSFTGLNESVDEVLLFSQIADDPISLHIILPNSSVGKLQGSQGHCLKQLRARSGVQVNLISGHLIDSCCFYYFVRNSLVALLEALCARIFS